VDRDVCRDEPFLPETDLGFHYPSAPQDTLVTLSGGRLPGLLRHGPLLTPANLRYRLRSMKHLDYQERPRLSLVLQDLIRSRARLFS
jgi:hypothetical protein